MRTGTEMAGRRPPRRDVLGRTSAGPPRHGIRRGRTVPSAVDVERWFARYSASSHADEFPEELRGVPFS